MHNNSDDGKNNGKDSGVPAPSGNGQQVPRSPRSFARFTGAQKRALELGLATALDVLGRAPEGSYGRVAGVLERFAHDDNKRVVAEWVRNYLSPGSPGAAWLKHLLTSVHPNVRRHFVAQFTTHVLFNDGQGTYRLPDGRTVGVLPAMVISPTMRCNLACVGCYAGSYTKKDDLTPAEVERVIGEARDMGTRFFVVTGGEPLMYEPLFDIFAKFDDCAFQMYTSGHLMTAEKAKRIVELGNVVPAVSVEGFQEETDYRRGPGGYDRVMRAFDLLREARAMYSFSATVTRKNIDVVTSDVFCQAMVDKGCHYGWFFSYMPIGRNPDISLMPTPEERNRSRIAVNSFRKCFPILVADFWNDGAFTEGCLSAGRKYVHINNHGDVEPCVFSHFAVDNIREKSLAECLASDYFVAMRKAAPYGRNLLRPCPIIDHPKVLRTLVRRYGARPTHAGAESVLTGEVAEHLDRYAEELENIYDPVWAEEYRWAARLHSYPPYDFSKYPPRKGAASEQPAATESSGSESSGSEVGAAAS